MNAGKAPELRAEIADELQNLGSLVNLLSTQRDRIPENREIRSVYLESMALKLHNFYTGIERIFRKIAEDLNGGLPPSSEWHKRLLLSMSLTLDSIRPAVISKDTLSLLEDYLSFRHVVRNIYGFEIKEEKLFPLVKNIGKVWNEFSRDMNEFLLFLEEIQGA
ncbi:MAG: hypothetical protein ACLFQB_13575 [Chitinispirillaceae bacterium]